ncbi:hypothetical protein DN069_31135 [Streptacidiphilus pinicola]|uniref:Uncharacterized protein n=1 Tax=Streptacidiphilus pinicola TaxID=2219663 RepID=A0A2X0IVS5_9ACTN|nr:hypothetical protein DN069_31135 [Streptacidiphilus pinicola]
MVRAAAWAVEVAGSGDVAVGDVEAQALSESTADTASAGSARVRTDMRRVTFVVSRLERLGMYTACYRQVVSHCCWRSLTPSPHYGCCPSGREEEGARPADAVS